MIKLRDYQIEGVRGITKHLIKNERRIAYNLPTGGGKTVVFCFVSKAVNSTGKKVILTVHRKRLLMQTSLSLAEIGVMHRIIAPKTVVKAIEQKHYDKHGKSFLDESTSIAVASVQTLVRRMHELDDCNMLVIDECHHAAAGYWEKCIKAAPDATILGVSATLIRLDGRGLKEYFDVIVQGPSMQKLIDRGHLCKPRVFASEEQIDLSNLRYTRKGDFNEELLAVEMDKPYLIGNTVNHYKAICDKVPAIAYCCNITHAEHTAYEYKQSGYNAICLTSRQSEDEQFRILDKLAAGEIHVVTSVDIISEGTDVPLVGCGISLRPTHSIALWDQQFGRPMRPYPDLPIMKRDYMQKLIMPDGQHTSFFLDHAGNSHRHGLPTQGRNWSLEDDYRPSSRKKEKNVPIKTCPKCNNIHIPAPVCPECGHEYKEEQQKYVHTRSGELVELEITPEWAKGSNLKEEKLSVLLKKAISLEQIEAIATARGYQYGWVKKQIMIRHDYAKKFKRKRRGY